MPRSEPEPAASPLLVGALMPPLVPPDLRGNDVSAHHADVARVGGLLLVLGEFVQVDLIAQRREIVHVRQQPLFDAFTRGSTGCGIGLG